MNAHPPTGPGPDLTDSRIPRPTRRLADTLAPLAVVAGAAGVLLIAGGGALIPTREVRVEPAVFDRADHPTAATAGPARAVRTVQTAGWIEADPYYIACTALAEGVVEEILVLEGERVEAGQVVARLVAEDAQLEARRAEADLAFALAAVARAEADFAAARADWEHPVERERAVGATLAALDEARGELAQLPALIARERATAERLVEELARSERALGSGASNEIEVIVLRKNLAAQRASLEAMTARGPILEAMIRRLEAEATAASRNAELRIAERRALDAAEAGVHAARAEADRARARLDEALLRLDRMTIRAPVGGWVQARLAAPGDKLMFAMDSPHSMHLLHLYDPSQIQVRVDVPLADAGEVSVGQPCEVVVEILPERPFRGEVTRITNQADLQKNTLQVKVRVIDPSPLLKPEMLSRVTFQGGHEAGPGDDPGADAARAVRVPAELIAARSGSEGVWAVRGRSAEKGRLAWVPIVRVEESGGWARVRGALHPGDLVAQADADFKEGLRVRFAGAETGQRAHDARQGGAE